MLESLLFKRRSPSPTMAVSGMGTFGAPAQFFNPVSLFEAGEQGAWYDSSDFSSMFQDSAGTVPVTAVEQPVGLVLDKRLGLVRGIEVATNGTFDSDTNWSKGAGCTITGGKAVFSAATGGFSQPSVGMIAGRFYEFIITVESISSGTLRFASGGGGYTGPTISSTGTFRCILVPTLGGTLSFGPVTTPLTAVIDNVSVREIPGNHATQPTAASRPVLSARVNRLTKSEQLDDGAWAKTGCTISVQPGTMDAVVESSGVNEVHTLTQVSVMVVAGAVLTSSWKVKAVGRPRVSIDFPAAAVFGGTNPAAFFDLITGTIVGVPSASSASITPIGNDEYIISITATATAAGSTGARLATNNGVSNTYIGDGRIACLAGEAQLEFGPFATRYQRVNTATDYDSAGFPHYLKFDGVDDFLVTPLINMTAVSSLSYWTGATKLLQDTTRMICEHGVGGSDPRAFTIAAPRIVGASNFGSQLRDGINTNDCTTPNAYGLNTPYSISGQVFYDAASVSAAGSIRVNGNTVAGGSINSGTGIPLGTFGNYALRVGARSGSAFFNGQLNQLIIRGAATPLATIEQVEAYVAGKTGVIL